MAITGVNSASKEIVGNILGKNGQNDAISKNIKNEIARAQKKLQDLSANNELSIEDKMKKRQEILQEITNLEQQLRQHEIEQRRKQQSESASTNDMQTTTSTASSKGNGLSQASTQAIISADVSMKQAKAQGRVVNNTNGKVKVLSSEIKMDKGRGTSSKKKEAELQSLEEKAQAASKAQMASLSDVNKSIKEATTDNSDSVVKDNKDKAQESKTNTSSNLEAISKNKNNIKNSDNANSFKNTAIVKEIEESQVDKKQIIHTSVDVYL